ncbi:hypothetical protein [uncultured Clostridium sp.]|uniref:hypothetical protein n=1 Tax=uncultured Clostridium sp. TaxID=59620 RepID=UPI002584426C|nr:hypothetical protein [uncultured Clostridium sp.]
MEELMKKIKNEIDSIYDRYKDIRNQDSDLKYVIAYLDEIEGSIHRYFNGRKILRYMIESRKGSYDFRKKIDLKLSYWTLKNIIDFYQKKMYTMFDDLDLKNLKGLEELKKLQKSHKNKKKSYQNKKFKCNNDNHNISNRLNYYRRKKQFINLEDMKKFESIMTNDLKKLCYLTISFLESIKNISEEELIKVFKKDIKSFKKDDINIILKKSCLNKQNSEIDDKYLKAEMDKCLDTLISNKTIDIEKNILIYDSIFRLYEANHLVNITYEFQKHNNSYFCDFEDINFFTDDILINMGICLVSSAYDKIGKEIIGNHFSTILNESKYLNKKNIYISNDYIKKNIKNFEKWHKISRDVFKIKNTLLHSHIPGRLLIDSELGDYQGYKIRLIRYNSIIILEILNSLLKFNVDYEGLK